MPLKFTQLASDTFVRANENPLNPANWTTASGYSPLQVLNNAAQPTTSDDTDNISIYTSVAFPPDQYVEIKVAASNFATTAACAAIVRCDSTGNIGVFLYVYDKKNGTAHVIIITFSASNLSGTFIYENDVQIFVPGDVFRLAAIGLTVYAFQNGTQFFSSGVSSSLIPSSGSPAVDLFSNTADEVKANNFAAGSAVSVPDTIFASQTRYGSEGASTFQNIGS